MLSLFMLFVMLNENSGALTVVIGICCVVLLGSAANTLYSIVTGKVIGTKTHQRVMAFDTDYIGWKRWKRRKIIEFIILIILCIGISVVLFTVDFGSARLNFPMDAFPMLGGWIGMNIGKMSRFRIYHNKRNLSLTRGQ
ncbi:hypothetical protein VKA52_13020 [Halobacillus sp. HZG1]|uniref:hypothetical protein n=1 Tax=Halobacillus sp. HZG1 TaxID=3111769 RepID=UPI002DBE38BB|nr:hypothetical protein [Halobacillus sp. HZG1]MEC3884647.1 hypothetical protein [Halobacillus sp. HZG1]